MTSPPPVATGFHSADRFPWHRFLDLTMALVVRDFKGQYRRSLMGPAWAVIQPFMYMAVFSLLRGAFDIPSDGMPYALFTFAALAPWTFFANAVSRGASSVYGNGGIIKKMAIPREIFPSAAVGLSLVDFAISLSILLLMMAWFSVSFGLHLLWLLPLILITALLGLGVAMGIAAIGTFRRDVIFAVPFLMQFWMLASPIMYPSSKIPEQWRSLYDLNPMVGIVEGFRRVLLHGLPPDASLLATSLLGCLLVWLLAWPLFRLCSQYFADVL